MSWFVLSSLSTSTSSHFPLQSNRYNSSFAAARTTIHNISDKKMSILILYIEELIAFILHLNFRKFENGGKWYGNLPGKFPESARTVEFLRCELFNRKFWKFWEQSLMERKVPGRNFWKFGYITRIGNFEKCSVLFATGSCRKFWSDAKYANCTKKVRFLLSIFVQICGLTSVSK